MSLSRQFFVESDDDAFDDLLFSSSRPLKRKIDALLEQRKKKLVLLNELIKYPQKVVIGRKRNKDRSVGRRCTVERIESLKNEDPKLFTRMFRLHPADFSKVLEDIRPRIMSQYFHASSRSDLIDPVIKLAVCLRFLAGGIFLDLSWGYWIPHNHVHDVIWEVCEALDATIDNIKFPINDVEELKRLSSEFHMISRNKFKRNEGDDGGTVAAGDGVIFKMNKPTIEETDGDVTSFFTRKGYYAYALQAFCDARCKFLSISSQCCSSTHDSTAYVLTSLSKAIKEGLLDSRFHIVLDEAYICTDQELTPWKGRQLSVKQDSFNYYLSLHRQVIERAFGLLVQRWGIYWRPLRISLDRIPLVVNVTCKLHNICVDRFTSSQKVIPYNGGPRDTDFQEGDDAQSLFTDGTGMRRGHRSDLDRAPRRCQITEYLFTNGHTRPERRARFSRAIQIVHRI